MVLQFISQPRESQLIVSGVWIRNVPILPPATPVVSTAVSNPTPPRVRGSSLALVMTTDSYTDRFENTLLWLKNLKARGLPITVYIYTSSAAVTAKCAPFHFTIRPVQQRSRYGLPVLSSLLRDAQKISSDPYIGYINSDILLNPNIMSVLNFISSKKKQMFAKKPVLLGSRVCDYSSTKNIRKEIVSNTLFKSAPRCRMRNIASADIFIFSRDFPFSVLPPAVPGRTKIDNILMDYGKRRGVLIDITYAYINIHQGSESYRNVKRVDAKYNIRFLKRMVTLSKGHYRVVRSNRSLSLKKL